MLDSRYLGLDRRRARGDQHRLGAHRLSLQGHGVRIFQCAADLEQIDAGIAQEIDVDAVEAVDLGVLVGDERGPVEARRPGVPAEGPGILEVLAVMGAIDQELFGDAAANDAGAADPKFLAHADAGAVRGGDPGRAHPTRAGADDEEVVIGCRHRRSPRPLGAQSTASANRPTGRSSIGQCRSAAASPSTTAAHQTGVYEPMTS